MPQHVIFAFRFQNELALFFFWGQNELAQFSSEGGFELALFFFWADFGFFLRPFRASSLSSLYLPGPRQCGVDSARPSTRWTRWVDLPLGGLAPAGLAGHGVQVCAVCVRRAKVPLVLPRRCAIGGGQLQVQDAEN